jgi:hypothetical protein
MAEQYQPELGAPVAVSHSMLLGATLAKTTTNINRNRIIQITPAAVNGIERTFQVLAGHVESAEVPVGRGCFACFGSSITHPITKKSWERRTESPLVKRSLSYGLHINPRSPVYLAK